MAKALLYRLFGVGGMPQAQAEAIEREGVVLRDDGIRATITLINYRAPGRYSAWQRRRVVASLALTGSRFLAMRLRRPVIDVPLADARLRTLKIAVEADGALLVAFDPAAFHAGQSGTIECRFRTDQARAFADALRARMA